ncbi:hypothetical protein NESM_000758900 [Novymonas esmeraldas]|uniref:Uncharacterized protein n=1 Tax=Novymonas esmeraldas TaxID=1808958 RepID=A0AAW0EYX8_9TRYP
MEAKGSSTNTSVPPPPRLHTHVADDDDGSDQHWAALATVCHRHLQRLDVCAQQAVRDAEAMRAAVLYASLMSDTGADDVAGGL